jgi:hypothetical protein
MNIVHWRCWIGHNWSSWVHLSSRCTDERFCKNCPEVERVPNHRWGQWGITMSKIIQVDSQGQQNEYDHHSIQVHSCQDCNYTQSEDY